MQLPTLKDITTLVRTKEGIKALFDYMNNQKDRVDYLKKELLFAQEEIERLKLS
jgi:hypothetical protein